MRPYHLNGGRKPLEQRPVSQTVRLSPETADLVCQLALRRRVSVYSLLGGIIERVFEKQKIAARSKPEYDAAQHSSTLSTMLSESPSLRASRNADPSTPR